MELKKLQKEIEIRMVELAALQDLHDDETGRTHVMPLYLATPEHLKGVARRLIENCEGDGE